MENKTKKMAKTATKILLLAIMILINVNLLLAEEIYLDIDNINQNISDGNLILLELDYGSAQEYDIDNDGNENIEGVIDFTVGNTKIDSSLNIENLCTRWEVFSVENEESILTCYGNEECCNFINLIPTRSLWNEPFYFTYTLYGTSYNNVISAQVIYVDYDIDSEEPYSNVYYSEWASLPGNFNTNEYKNIPSGFSSSVMPTTQSSTSPVMEITILSPDNSSNLQSGENVYLNFTTNVTSSCNYTFDGEYFDSFIDETEFFHPIRGKLGYDTLRNGEHIIIVNCESINEDTIDVKHSFIVEDLNPPEISLNIENNSDFIGEYLELEIDISSDEYTNISYNKNSGGFSDYIDLGSDKTETILFELEEGQNLLDIEAQDFHNNLISLFYLFNYQEGNCSDALLNGDEFGIDCSGRCPDCIPFEVSTDKVNYSLTDNVYVTVLARADSIVDLVAKKDNEVTYEHTFTPVFSGAPIYETRLIQNTNNAGIYEITAIMTYINITEEIIIEFEVLPPSSNPLSVTINANKSSISESEKVSFSASISGHSGTLGYKWDFENDGTIDSTNTNPIEQFNRNGSYTVNLTVNDDFWSQTDIHTINVKKLHNVTFRIKDNHTQSYINKIEVEFDDTFKNTSGDGKVIFTRPTGSYNVRVDLDGYRTYSDSIDVIRNEKFFINLTQQDEKSPAIQLIYPSNGITLKDDYIVFKYKAIDNSMMTCRLYTSEIESDYWILENSDSFVNNNKESSLPANLTVEGTYEWKIQCIDREGNSNSSPIFNFTIDKASIQATSSPEQEDLNVKNEATGDLITQIDSVIASIDLLGLKEKEASDAMGLRKKLEKAKTEVERANRDLNSLKWRRLNETEIEVERNKILEKIENVKKTTPKNIVVKDTNEFVNYPSNNNIETILLELLNKTNYKFKEKDLKKLVEKNHELQSKLTVTTKVKIVEVEYISGIKGTITLIQKLGDIDEDSTKISYYELIPKEIAKDTGEVEFLFDHEVINKDPIIKIDLEDIKDFSFYLKKEIDLEETQKIVSILIDDNIKPERSSFITGSAIFETIASKIMDGSDMRLVIEIAVIILLVMIYLIYSFGGWERIKKMFVSKDIKEIRILIKNSEESLIANNYDSASVNYRNLNAKFKSMKKDDQATVKAQVIEILNKVNMLYINKLSDEAQNSISRNDKKKAFSLYKRIQSLYKIIPKQHKAEVSRKCMDLHKKLSAK